MAILTFASPVSGLRGKVGGNIFSANKGGPYLKAWSRGSNPRTFVQSGHRANFISFSTTWITLSQANRDSWDTYAALTAQDLINSLGETYSISGFNWFIRINLNRESFGDGLLSAAPTGGTPATPIIQVVDAFSTAAAGVTNIKLTAGSPGLGERLAIKAEMAYGEGRQVLSQIRTFMLTQQQSIGTVNFGFKTELLEHFGTAQIGQKVFCSILHQSSEGRRSAPANGSDVINT